MDIRTGRTYGSFEDARADGVPESDIARVDMVPGETVPRVRFRKHKPFARFKNVARVDSAQPIAQQKAD